MDLKDLIVGLTKSVLDEERRGEIWDLPMVCGIKNGKVVLSSSLNLKLVDDRFASIAAGYMAGLNKCDAVYYICRSLMRHYTKAEYEFTINNFTTENPALYPESQRINSYVFGVVDSLNEGKVTSYAVSKDGGVPDDKTLSIGTCEHFYPQLLSIGYNLKSTIDVMNAYDVISSVESSDLVIIERGNILERELV